MAFIKASVDLTVDLLKWLNSLKLISAAAVKKKMVLKKKKDVQETIYNVFVFFRQHPKTNKYSVYCYIKQRKTAHPQMYDAEMSKCIFCWLAYQ